MRWDCEGRVGIFSGAGAGTDGVADTGAGAGTGCVAVVAVVAAVTGGVETCADKDVSVPVVPFAD